MVSHWPSGHWHDWHWHDGHWIKIPRATGPDTVSADVSYGHGLEATVSAGDVVEAGVELYREESQAAELDQEFGFVVACGDDQIEPVGLTTTYEVVVEK